MRRITIASVAALACLAGACSESAPTPDPAPGAERSRTSAAPSPTSDAPTPPAPPAEPVRRASPDDVRVATAVAAVEHLAGTVGPRPGTSAAYRRAARWVAGRFRELGWSVEQQRFPTPAGVSWGIPVRGGPSTNVIATRGDVRPGRPWLLVGAHLDTVPQAPGAEDNASGVGVLLAVAEALAGRRSRLPVVLVAFGSEEPRGPSDDDHHYGSRAYVAGLSTAERGSLNGMVSLDRVGVGSVLPVGSAGDGDQVQRQLLAAAERAGVPAVSDLEQRSSDHWSFVRAGLPGARLGSTSYAAYHRATDVPAVVSRDQLGRTARTVVSWLR
ncbi:M28 family metallopeptidase [Nocardioides marmotae]|uniref:M28 family metallopeptidase n=1 Tax=Nocardioides marmotae TaxID=2663857 RepID=UPI0012B53C74|nr:M28 family peptidase [Nocardioides marmotae]MBC9732700.1 M28 family peptidase [Nocardioides marmotae]MTB83817.1 M28 family peptidase [Nocardioides marmotae]